MATTNASSTTAQPMTAAAFINTIGVDTQVSTGAALYWNIPDVIADLNYLGIDNVRAGDNGLLSSLITMAQAGVKFDFLMAGGGSMTTAHLQSQFAVIDQVSEAVAGSVTAVEGANEINNFPITYNGVGGMQGAINLQQDIYTMAHGDANLPGISVYYFTGYDGGPNPATTPGLADYDNQHPYPNNGNPPLQWVNRTQALSNETPATGPAVYTETGYSNTGTFGGNLGLTGQAKYTLDLLMDTAQIGIAHTYLYELMEEGDGLGLFDANNNPKPVATAIHDLTSILADSGTVPASAVAANFSVSNLPSDGHDMALIKSTGATDIVVWAEPQITATTSGPATNVTVSLGATYGTVKVFDPLQSASPFETLFGVSSVVLSVTDHPLIVETEPGATPTPAPTPTPTPAPTPTPTPAPTPTPTPAPTPTPTPAPTPTPTPAPTDTLTLSLSQDALMNSNARFVVDVDGIQAGGTLTANALNSSGESEVFTLNGKWGQGLHDVKIQFLTGAPSPSTAGPHLYVNEVSYDGLVDSVTPAAMMSAGTTDFAVGGNTPVVPAPSLDVLTLHVSEDMWKGDAQFRLTIDGKTITTPQNVTVLHSSGQWENVTFLGNLGAGTHTVGVAFTNDAYGGTPTTDRNLYVNGIDVNGTHYGTGVTTLLSNGMVQFTVTTTH